MHSVNPPYVHFFLFHRPSLQTLRYCNINRELSFLYWREIRSSIYERDQGAAQHKEVMWGGADLTRDDRLSAAAVASVSRQTDRIRAVVVRRRPREETDSHFKSERRCNAAIRKQRKVESDRETDNKEKRATEKTEVWIRRQVRLELLCLSARDSC